MKAISKNWEETVCEKAEIWDKIEETSLNLYQLGAFPQNLVELNKHLSILKILTKQIERVQVVDALEKPTKIRKEQK